MPRRVDYHQVAPEALRSILSLEQYLRKSSLERPLYELVKLRASYMNGCAYCIDMHTKDARAAGESEQRLYAIPVWHEAPFFSERERAAFAWTEAVTRLGPEGVPAELFSKTREHFSERELVDLTFAIVAINSWNRLAIALGADVGSYRPAQAAHPS